MKKQGKNLQDQINEEELGNLPEKEFRVMIVKMIQNLGNRMEAWIEKIQEMFNKDLEELQSCSLWNKNHFHRKTDKMKRQKVMYQMKEQDKTAEKQLNEVEIGNLPEKEFRIMKVKMIQDLGKKNGGRASLVAQWLRIYLLMQGTRVQALVWKIPHATEQLGP